MRESKFIEQNKEKWQEFESALQGKVEDPEKMGELFIGITDDLSYARTFYPNRSVRVYLNNLSQRVFHTLYRKRAGGWRRFKAFWTNELPAILYSVRKELLLSFVVFALSMAVGWISKANDPSLTPGWTFKEFMDYYSEQGELDFFMQVTVNNIWVAFLTFAMGIVFGIGTLVILITNGVYLGIALRTLHEMGRLTEGSLSLWMHGTIEISAIVIAGAAGLVIGTGLALPGTLPRSTSFLYSGTRGIRVMLGVVPLFLIAGLIEGFLTRHVDVPTVLRLLVIFLSAVFIIWYFVIYPWLRSRAGAKETPPQEVYALNYKIRFNGVKSNGEIFKDVFVFIKNKFGVLFIAAAALSAGMITLVALTDFDVITFLPWTWTWIEDLFLHWDKLFYMFNNGGLALLLATAIALATMAWISLHLIAKAAQVRTYAPRTLTASLVFGASVVLMMQLGLPWGWLLAYLVTPFIGIWMASASLQEDGLLRAMSRTSRHLANRLGRVFALMSVLLVMVAISFFIVGPLMWLLSEVVNWFAILEGSTFHNIYMLFLSWFVLTGLLLSTVIVTVGFGMQLFTLREIRFAPDLQKRVERFGQPQGEISV